MDYILRHMNGIDLANPPVEQISDSGHAIRTQRKRSIATAAAVFLLLVGLGSALAAASPAITEALQDAALSGSRFAPVWKIVVQTAPLQTGEANP